MIYRVWHGVNMEKPLLNYTLEITPRVYQKHAIELMHQRYRDGDRTFHIVAPPGSGKTVLGLQLLLNQGDRALVLSPSCTIATQWINTARKLLCNGTDPNENCDPIVGDSIEDYPPILSLTYQAFSVKGKNGVLHDNAAKIADYLINNNYRTIVLDECHHLVTYWAEVIQAFIDRHPKEVLIIGLTATPPIDRSSKEKGVYLDILEEVDYEIPIPAVVKEGSLAPFQDIPYIRLLA